MIVLALDFTSAESYLALEPTISLAEDIRIPLDILPFRVKPRPIPMKHPDESPGERHARLRAEYRDCENERYARVQGLELRACPQESDPTIAHAALMAAREYGVGIEFAWNVFKSYWDEELELEDMPLLESMLGDLGVTANLGRSQYISQQRQAREWLKGQDVFSVPTFLVEGERFIGRQHLPMIRQTLVEKKQLDTIA